MSTIHVVPIDDLIEHHVPGGLDGHEATEGCPWLAIEAATDDVDCVCGPAVELVPNPAGPEGWLVTHHGLDGRELNE